VQPRKHLCQKTYRTMGFPFCQNILSGNYSLELWSPSLCSGQRMLLFVVKRKGNQFPLPKWENSKVVYDGATQPFLLMLPRVGQANDHIPHLISFAFGAIRSAFDCPYHATGFNTAFSSRKQRRTVMEIQFHVPSPSERRERELPKRIYSSLADPRPHFS